ncbi:MAG: GNAT family N-acetyltransferase [Planctomycetes bacterium]|nr:GNAT family N-acetyltransferase [Planctomycetota bacterium]
MIRSATTNDAQGICDIYNHYVARTVITFEEEAVPSSEMQSRIKSVVPTLPWLVAEIDGVVQGYAYASPWRARSAYRYAVESTVYLAPERSRQGLGSELYASLLSKLSERRLHCAFGVIALPNPASVAIHEKFGFHKVGELKQVGWKFDRWVDVGYWQLML